MLNRIVIQGRLTRDPELRRTQSGIAVTSFSLAVERSFKTQNGERETDFFDVVAWRGTAEFVTKYFTKGRMAIVEGRLEFRDWVDREGQKRRSAEVVADNVHFAGDSPRRDNSGEYGAPSYGASPSSYASGGSGAGGYASAPGYGSAGYNSGSAAPGYGGSAGYGSEQNHPQSDFSEISDEDGELPF